MFSNVIVKLTGVFLILYISATFASPTAQPEEALALVPLADKLEVDEDIHARARPPYRPYLCQYPYAWIRRECEERRGPRAWLDVCGWATYATRFETQYDNQPGICPQGTYCLDTFNAAGKPFIRCLGKGKRALGLFDAQAGTSDPKRARMQKENTQLEYSVQVDHNMKGASVAAVLASKCHPANIHCRMSLCSCWELFR